MNKVSFLSFAFRCHIFVFLFLILFSFKEASPEIYEHPWDSENFKNGFEDGSLDAEAGVFSVCAAKKCRAQNPYERGYKLGYKKGARQNKSPKKSIDPLIDSPGKTRGSDFNGDGIHDVLVGAWFNDSGGGSNSGAAYVFFGTTTLSGTKSTPNTSADVAILGKANQRLGRSLASAGDINGDGIDDIIAGAAFASDGGMAYIFFGATTLSGSKDLSKTDSADVTFVGKGSTDKLGFSVSGAGDVNGDGFDDVIVGAPYNDDAGTDKGAVYIFFGAGNLSGTKNLGGAQSADVTFLGKVGSDLVGASVSGADVNGDGFDDVIIGAYGNDAVASSAGEAYIFFGASNLSGTKNLDTTASPDVTFQGKTGNSRLGFSLSGGGDINGDGFEDIIVSSPPGGATPGEASIFYGSSTISGTKGAASANVEFLGKSNSDLFGKSVSGAGDINDDGFDDVIVGADQDDSGTTDAGAAYIFFGASDLSGTKNLKTTASADVTIVGKATSPADRLGKSVSSAGDVNADGIPDIIVGAYRNSDAAYQAGAAYIFFGATTLSGTQKLGGGQSADVSVTGQASNDELGFGVGGGRSSPGP